MSVQISGIYRILNKINGKSYVGSAVDFISRQRDHKKTLRKNKHHSILLQRAWNKYGEDNFEFIVLEEIKDISKLLERENYWIQFYDSANSEKGYNICPIAGNHLGLKYTPEVCAKISRIQIERNKQNKILGIPHFNTGKKRSDETREKNRLALLGKQIGIDNPFFGKHHTEETLEKNRQAHLGKLSPMKGKHFTQFCPKGHNKDIVGRNTQNRCRECDRINGRIRYQKLKGI